MDLIIHYHKVQNFNLVGYSDIDWARSRDRKSTSGFVFILGLGAVT